GKPPLFEELPQRLPKFFRRGEGHPFRIRELGELLHRIAAGAGSDFRQKYALLAEGYPEYFATDFHVRATPLSESSGYSSNRSSRVPAEVAPSEGLPEWPDPAANRHPSCLYGRQYGAHRKWHQSLPSLS